jgi:hypothetical protein
MSRRDVRKPRAPRGHFPRPNLTMRELIGLVLAFALSNALLSWLTPGMAQDPVVFVLWNGMLAFYLGFAFLQAWIGSVIRWTRTGDADPPGLAARRWTALGVAEATVIGGTMLCCVPFLFGLMTSQGVINHDRTAPIGILLIGSAGGILVLRMWRKPRRESLTGREVEPTIEVGPRIEKGETR